MSRSPRAEPPLRFFDMLRFLREHGVDFILFGDFSLAFHGHPRGTDDVDIVPDPAPANLERLWAALLELGAEPRDLGHFAQTSSRPSTSTACWEAEAGSCRPSSASSTSSRRSTVSR